MRKSRSSFYISLMRERKSQKQCITDPFSVELFSVRPRQKRWYSQIYSSHINTTERYDLTGLMTSESSYEFSKHDWKLSISDKKKKNKKWKTRKRTNKWAEKNREMLNVRRSLKRGGERRGKEAISNRGRLRKCWIIKLDAEFHSNESFELFGQIKSFASVSVIWGTGSKRRQPFFLLNLSLLEIGFEPWFRFF